MLHDDGTFAFRAEILEAVESVVQAYRQHTNGDQTELEHELLITFVLGRIRCELDVICEAMGSSPTLNGLSPQELYEECVTEDPGVRECCVAQMVELLRERGWIGVEQSKETA